MINRHIYRLNVGIIICNYYEQVMWVRQYGQYAWQFPQGGIQPGESAEQAMYRELFEKFGLNHQGVRILSSTRHWLHYKLPKRLVHLDKKPVYFEQKQKWFLIELASGDDNINMKASTSNIPEFDEWRWVSYWYPIRQVISFEREVYRKVMKEFSRIVMTLRKTTKRLY